jgi:hypothetical protein
MSSILDILDYGDNKSRGPFYNKSVTGLGTAYTFILPTNPNRKFLLIQPHQHPVWVHFLTPGADPSSIADANSIYLEDYADAAPFFFCQYVPTNAVYLKSSSSTINVTIFES